MMNQFLSALRKQGVTLWHAEESLKFKAYQQLPLTQEQLSFLKSNKAEIITWLKNNEDYFHYRPLSENQKSLWLAYQMDTGSCAYNLTHAEQLTDTIDVNVLKQAFTTLWRRHDILRTGYCDIDQESLQITKRKLTAPFTEIAVTEWSESDIAAWCRQESDLAFNVPEGDVIRAKLLINKKGSVQQKILQITVHHIAADFWACEVIFNELLSIYKDSLTGKQETKQEVIHDYFSWSCQQTQWLSSKDALDAKEFWRTTVSNAPTSLDMPIDYRRPAIQTFDGEMITFDLPETLNASLRSKAKVLGVTPYVLCLSIYQILLYRFSAQEKFFIGTPASGRLDKIHQDTVGYLVNPLAIKCECDGELTFRQWVNQVKSTTRAALEHQSYPFSKVLTLLTSERDPSRNPLFQHLFALTHVHDNEHSDLALHTYLSEQRGAALDLSLIILDDRKHFKGEFRYNSNLYTRDTALSMIDSYLEILTKVCQNLDAVVKEVNIVSPSMNNKLRTDGSNNEVIDFEKFDTVNLLAQQIKARPDAIAATYENQHLTFAELGHKTDILAGYLQSQGIGAEDKVVISQQRSLSMLVTMLAILKSGAAYVPVDPNYPTQRVAFMLQNAGAKLILTDQWTQSAGIFDHPEISELILPSIESAEDILISDRWPFDSNRIDPMDVDQLAYMIYTSGSTGKPKAVQITRANMSNLLGSIQQLLALKSTDRLLAVTSLSFDISVVEMCMPLISGGQIVIANNNDVNDVLKLKRIISDRDITCMQATPVTWKMLVTTNFKPNSDFTVISGGEPFPGNIAQYLLNQGNITAWNLYGPTETTIYSLGYKLNPAKSESYHTVPIGYPISNTSVYILDKNNQLVPPGAVGELCIAGAGLARCYFGREQLTEERFPTTEYGRIYRTGDLAKWCSDGTIECLGRLDEQVKIRGYRIELGEIESVLKKNITVQDCVVHTVQLHNDTVLVAYVVTNKNANINTESDSNHHHTADFTTDLQRYLKQTLPAFMVPSYFTVLPFLPTTPNGKVDKKQLPAPDPSQYKNEYVRPSTDTETKLCTLWQDLLSVKKIGIYDNFFKLGGNSLIAARMVVQVKQEFSIELSLQNLFGLSTLVELAGFIDQQQPSMSEDTFSRMDNLLDELGV